jgi:hypothetical protein
LILNSCRKWSIVLCGENCPRRCYTIVCEVSVNVLNKIALRGTKHLFSLALVALLTLCGAWGATTTYSSDTTLDNYTIAAGDEIIVTGGTLTCANGFTINGTLTINGGTVVTSGGVATNLGTITIASGATCSFQNGVTNGSATNATATITNSGTITSSGTITNYGVITNNASSTITITGNALVNESTGSISNSGTITAGTSITNYGAITNASTGTLQSTTGSISNEGTITNSGSVTNGAGSISNTGTINNESGGSVSGTISGTGTVNNNGGSVNGYSMSYTPTPAKGSTTTVTVSSTATFSELYLVCAVTDGTATTDEPYTVNGTAYSASQNVSITSISPTYSGSLYSTTFTIEYPATIDTGDGLSVTVYESSAKATTIGTVSYIASAADTTYYWVGGTSASWTVLTNWVTTDGGSTNPSVAPSATSVITIPSTATNWPEIPAGTTVASLTNKGTVTLSGAFTCSGAFVNSGTVNTSGGSVAVGSATESGVWNYTGGTVQKISGLTYNQLYLSGAVTVSGSISGAVKVTGAYTVTLGGDTAFSGAVTVSGNTTFATGVHALVFISAVNPSSGKTYSLTLKDAGTTTFSSTVGTSHSFASFASEGPVVLAGGRIATSSDSGGTQTYSSTLTGPATGTLFIESDGAVTCSGLLTADSLLLSYKNTSGTGAFTFNSAKINTVAANSIASLSIVNSQALTVGEISYGGTAYDGITAGGAVSLSAAGDITLSQAVTTSGTVSVTMTNGGIVNNKSSKDITIGSFTMNGDTTLYAQSKSIAITALANTNSKALTVLGSTVTLPADANVGALTVGDGSTASAAVLSGGMTASSVAIKSNGTVSEGTTAAAISVGDNWTDETTAGGFTPNDSTVTFTAASTIAGPTKFNNVVLKDTTSITGASTYVSLTASGLSAKTLTVGGAISVTTLALTGADGTHALTVTGTGAITLPSSQATGNYLSIGNDILIKDAGGTTAGVKYSATNSSPTAGASVANYNAVLAHGWNLSAGAMTYTWNGSSSSVWSLAANWNTGIVPSTSSDTIVIPALTGGSFTSSPYYPVIDSASVSCASLTVAEGAKLNANGKPITIANASGLTNNGTLLLAGTETISLASGSVVNGTNSTVEYTGASANTSVWGNSFVNLTIDSGATVTCGGDTTVSGTLVNGGTLAVDINTISFAAYSDGGSAGETITFANGGTLTYTGTAAVAIDSSITGASGAAIVLNGGAGTTLSGTATYNAANITTNGTLSLPSGTIGALTVNAGSVVSLGAGATTGALTVTGTLTAAGTLHATSISLASGSTFAINGDVTLSGDWEDNGATFTHNNKTVTFEPTATSTISGNTTFYNLTCSNQGGKTLSFNSNCTVSKTLLLSGTSESSRLTITGNAVTVTIGSTQIGGKYLAVADTAKPAIGSFVFTAVNSTTATTTVTNNWNIIDGDLKYIFSTTGNWETDSNWSTGVAPSSSATDTIIEVKSGVTLTFTAVNPAGGVGAVVSFGTLTNNGTVDMIGRSVSGTEFINNGTVQLYGNNAQTISIATITNNTGSVVQYDGTDDATRLFGTSYDTLKTTGASKKLDFNSATITISSLVSSGTLEIDAAGLTINGATLGGATVISSDALTLGGAIDGGANTITIKPLTSSVKTYLGAESGALSLTYAELDDITTSGTLTIGSSSTSGTISIAGDVSPLNASGAVVLQNTTGGIVVSKNIATKGSLALVTTGAVSGAGQISVNGGSGMLAISASSGITLNNSLGNLASSVALENSSTNDISYVSDCAFTVAAKNSMASGAISLENKLDSTGTITVGELTGASGTTVSGVVTGGTVTFTTSNAAVTQASAKLVSAGTLAFATGTGDVSLADTANAFAAVHGTGGAVTLSDKDGYTVDSTKISGSGNVTLSAASSGAITLQGDVISTGSGTSVTFDNPVVVDADCSVKATGGPIVFETAATINDSAPANTHTLTVDAGVSAGTVTFGGEIGATRVIKGLVVTASTTAINGGSVAATIQNYTTAITSGTTSLSLVSYAASDGAITFGGAVNMAGQSLFITDVSGTVTQSAAITADALLLAEAGTFTLEKANIITTLAASTGVGAISFTNSGSFSVGKVNTVSGITRTGDITLTATTGSITLAADVITSGTGKIIFAADVITSGASRSVTAGSGAISFSKTINGESAETTAFGINTTGTLTIGGAIGATTLASLTVGSASSPATEIVLNGGTAATTGSQFYYGPVTLGVAGAESFTASTTSFMGNLTGNTNSVTVTGNASFGSSTTNTVKSISELSVTGNATITSDTSVATITVDGTTTIASTSIATTGTQVYGGAVTLSTSLTSGTTLTANNGATLQLVTFKDSITGNGKSLGIAGNADVGSATTNTVSGVNAFSVTGTAKITSVLNSVATIDITGAATIASPTIISTGAQSYHDTITLAASTTLTALNGATAQTISLGKDITTGGTYSIVIDGNAVLSDGNHAVTVPSITFGYKLDGTTITGTTGNANLSIDVGSDTGTITFAGAVGSSVALGNVTIRGIATFENNFVQGTSNNFTLTSGKISVGVYAFIAGDVVLTSGTFTQTGNNKTATGGPYAQTTNSITTTTGTVMDWDATDAGGTLGIGGIDAEGALSFHLKDIEISGTLTVKKSITLLDLIVLNTGKVIINDGATLNVMRHVRMDDGSSFTNSGTGVLCLTNTTAVSVTDKNGVIKDNTTGKQNFGNVIITQGSTTKTFSTSFKATALTMSDSTSAFATITFADLTAATITNGTTTITPLFPIYFNGTTTVTNPVVFYTTGVVSLGDGGDSGTTADQITFDVGMTHTAGDTYLGCKLKTSADSISVASAKLIQNTTIATANRNCAFDGTITNGTSYALTLDAGTGAISFGGSVGSSTVALGALSVKAGSVTVNGNITAASVVFDSTPVVLKNNCTLTTSGSNGKVEFGSTLDDNTSGGHALTIASGTGALAFAGKIGSVLPLKSLTVSSCGTCTFKASCNVSGDVSVKNSGLLLSMEDADITLAGSFVQTGTGLNQLAGGIITTGSNAISFSSDVYLYGSTGAMTLGGGTGKIKCNANVHIAAGGKSVAINSPLEAVNFALYGGAVTLGTNATVTTTKDVILLGGNGFDDSTAADGESSVTELFTYKNKSRSTAAISLNSNPSSETASSAFPEKYPDGSAMPSSYNATLAGGTTITAGQNFYDNGVSLSGLTLRLKDNTAQTDAFAEAYNCTLTSVTVSAISGTAYLAAAEGCTDSGGNNANVCFSRPKLLVSTASGSGTYTVYDDVIRVEFVDSKSGSQIAIENSNNEISKAFANGMLSYTDGATSVTFTGAYTDADCQTSTDGKGDLAVFFIKASKSWNTDATGISSGETESTTRSGVHSSAVPYITIFKARSDVYESLRDCHKNRIAQYYGDPSATDFDVDGDGTNDSNSTSGKGRFTAVVDRCAPVLVAAYTGQELHTSYDSMTGASSQPEYDAHNFIEFQYSEAVNIGDISASGGDKNIRAQSSFSSASEHGGAITNSGSGIVVAGYASIASGKVTAGERVLSGSTYSGSASTTIHSLYRTFSTTAQSFASDAVQTHRIRIAVAGFVDGTVVANGKTYHNWNGYVTSAETPSGTVTPSANNFITDKMANAIDAVGATKHTLTAVTVNSFTATMGASVAADTTLYGPWDTSRPQYALYFMQTTTENTDADQIWNKGSTLYKNADGNSQFEMIGTTSATTSLYLDRIEFHVFDNTPTYSFTADPYNWVSRNGWYEKGNTDAPYENAYDISGGSRSTASKGKTNRTAGGIRRSSLDKATTAFSYVSSVNESTTRSFKDSDILQTSRSPFFTYATNEALSTPAPTDDSLYFALFLNAADSALPLTTTFSVTYSDSACFITDLAGNLITNTGSGTLKSIDRVVPEFSLNAAAVGKNELYMVFSKKLSSAINDDFSIVSKALEFITMDSNPNSDTVTLSDLSFTGEWSRKYENGNVSCVVFKLNRAVTLSDIENTWIRVKKPTTTQLDPITGTDAYVTPIIDSYGNYMNYYSCHALSDFAINAVLPTFAYDITDDGAGNMTEANALNIIHDFTGSKTNENRVIVGKDIKMQVNIANARDANNSGTVATSDKPIVFFDSSVTGTVADLYNKVTGATSNVWLPIALPSFITTANKPQNPDGLAQIDAESSADGFLRYYTIPDATEDGSFGWKSKDDVQFLFGLTDSSGKTITIDNDGDQDASTEKIPLYALRLDDENDITSFDIWQFSMVSKKLQRGGVTILNNVINPTNNEEAVVEVDATEGNLVVAVMTIDGNVIKYLEHAKVTAGTHYYRWNGKNNAGNAVARGLYFVRVVGEGIDETRKVMVVK